MVLIDGIVGLAIIGIVICAACYLLFGAALCMIEFFELLNYPFFRLRCLVAGADDEFAAIGRLLLGSLVSKLTGALIVGVTALYLGASVKATAIAAAVAFLFLG